MINPNISPTPKTENLYSASDELNLLLNLNKGWDGKRAPPPTSEVVRVGHQVLKMTPSNSNVHVMPDVEGGIALYFFGGGRHIEGGWNRQGSIMLSNDCEASLMLRDRTKSGSSSVDLPIDRESLHQAIEKIHSFLDDVQYRKSQL